MSAARPPLDARDEHLTPVYSTGRVRPDAVPLHLGMTLHQGITLDLGIQPAWLQAVQSGNRAALFSITLKGPGPCVPTCNVISPVR